MDYGSWFSWPKPIGRESVALVTGDDGEQYVSWLPTGYNLWESYHPMEDRPAGFRDFVQLVCTAEDVDAAFRMLGPLDDGWRRCVQLKGGFAPYRESVAFWLHNAEIMRGAIDLHTALLARDPVAIDRVLSTPRMAALPTAAGATVGGEQFGVQDVLSDVEIAGFLKFEEAEERIVRVVNGQMKDRVAFVLRRDQNKVGYLSLDVQPTSLLGALWLMFSRELMGELVTSQCEACHEWFSMSPANAKRGKQFCSGRCRTAAWREEHPEASTPKRAPTVKTKRKGGDKK